MDRARNITLLLLTFIASCALFVSLHTITNLPFTDQQIQSSVVDTWQVNAQFTQLTLAFLSAVILVSVVLSHQCRKILSRRLAIAAAVFSIIASVLFVASHVALSQRTTELTDQSFGRFYGLF